MRRLTRLAFGLAFLLALLPPPVLDAALQQTHGPFEPQSDEERARFLERAAILRTKDVGKGVTRTQRATLSDGTFTHDASIQTVDESQFVFHGTRGTEVGFRDTWRYNVAAYHLSRLLGIDMVPVTVERRFEGKTASFTWWVDEVLMDEAERLKTKVRAPDVPGWNRQLWTLRLFDQLIQNTDRNLGNMLIDRSWKVWMIDHTRAFRRTPRLANIRNLEQCDRRVLAALKALTAPALEARLGRWLRRDELEPLLTRRDAIVAFFEGQPQRLY